tara:strand:- start:486 stop:1451 length:966 start_codon:yes stop_codon:yes gene_type:complete
MNDYILDFEQPLKEIQDKIEILKTSSVTTGIDVSDSIEDLHKKLDEKKQDIYSKLNRWQKVQVARHPKRPYSKDYINLIVDDWYELYGDRKFSNDPAIISGIGKIDNIKVAIIAQEKGRGTKDKLYRNFGMPRPEGYRKALRIMKLAEKFNLPILTLIDTPGAYPGIGAEERGQAQAIADNLIEMSDIEVPIISIVIGEGASGGALAIGLCDKLLCLENTWFSVISPEGCASILFRDPSMAQIAANSMKVSSIDLYDFGIADEIIPEPLGGAHSDYKKTATTLKQYFVKHLNSLNKYKKDELLDLRMKKYNNMGKWSEFNE